MERRLIIIKILVFIVVPTFQIITFKSEPQDDVVKTGDQLRLPCHAVTTTLNGNLITTWSKDGSWITDYQNKHFKLEADGSLFFLSFLPSDEGVYQCSAVVLVQGVNTEQKQSRTARIKLAFIGSKFLHSTKAVAAKIGSTVYLQCMSPESLPVPLLFWQKEDKNISGYASQVVNFRISSTLTLSNISFDDIGLYKCLAYNPMLTSIVIESKDIVVTIKADQLAPYFYVKPKLVVATRFLPTQINCRILGSPLPEISWFKNNIKLKNGTLHRILTNGSLFIPSVRRNDSGRYKCSGSNKHGTILSPSVPLIVAYIDYDFIVNPTNAVVISGNAFTLNCFPPASYPANPDIIWFFNYKKIEINNNRNKLYVNGSLVTLGTSIKDQGKYHCEAVNKLTNEVRTSRKAFINILAGPEIVTTPTNFTVKSGMETIIMCRFNGNPMPSTHWNFVGFDGYESNISQSENFKFVFNGLQIKKVKKQNEGWYTCIGRNQVGMINKRAFLHVLVPPENYVFNTVVTANNTENALFTCNSVGDPFVSIYWLRANQVIYNSGKFQTILTSKKVRNLYHTTSQMTIQKVSLYDAGMYMCVSQNNVGNMSSTISLTVQVPPSIKSFTLPGFLMLGQTLTILCQGFGIPTPVVILKQNGTIIYSEHHPQKHNITLKLTVHKLSSIHSGNYSCSMRNQLGSVEQQKYVVIKVLPHAPTLSFLDVISLSSIKVSWQPNFDGYSPIHLYNLQIKESKHGAWFDVDGNISSQKKVFIVHQLKPYTLYYTRLRAKNAVGFSNFSLVHQARTLQGAPSQPLNITVMYKNATSIRLTWFPPARCNGIILWYQIMTTTATLNVSGNHMDGIVNNLTPYTEYVFKIRGVTGSVDAWLYGNFSSIGPMKTDEALPVAILSPPQAKDITTNSFKIIFSSPPQKEMNGLLLGYKISLFAGDRKTSFTTNLTSYFFNLLKPYTTYKVGVAAFNSIGVGPSSPLIVVMTKTDLPGKVRNIVVTPINESFINLSWNEPIIKNGVITGYKIFLNNTITQELIILASTKTNMLIGNLSYNVTYAVYVSATTSAGIGSQQDNVVTFRTGLAPTLITTVTVPLASTSSWLEREYMIVIIAISAFAFFVLMILFAVMVSKCSCEKKEKDNKAELSSGWELNPYYDNDGSMQKRGPSNSTPPTIQYRDFRDDFIWDEDSFGHSSIEPDYAVAITPVINYASVEPYQGQRVELSPLVKLKGVPKKRKLSYATPVHDHPLNDKALVPPALCYSNPVTESDYQGSGGDFPRPPSLSNLDLIDALIESELGVDSKKTENVDYPDDLFERLGEFESIDLNNCIL
ncbi:protein sax-3-like isoform X2 [Hydractinia symbiolongicarpus]|uniref:protein sax-3-like isoform X2 n=1 Tax=Hydractinia symbiolongicarpus TaxID=13093 RepID=UPI00254DDDBC|nr:protein sax-3-like isoform X2 [Hydractinia symbiolongicarpus]